jgi:hypothetical protein
MAVATNTATHKNKILYLEAPTKKIKGENIMKTKIYELAKELTKCASKPFSFGKMPKGIKRNLDLKNTLIDYNVYFTKQGFSREDFREFCRECDKLGFEVLPLELSCIAIFTHLYGKGKIVIQEKTKA